MDWITLLRSLQSDFIKRLSTGCLLHCQTEGQYSELTIISGERLKALREFCWEMAEKYKRTSPVREVFINNLKGKLGEEVVKERLADFITEVDYEKRFGGDGKIDFTLTAEPSIGIEVKSRHGSIDKVRWSLSKEEVEKNAVVVCILIQEHVSEAQPEYHLFLAGFLPTQMIKLRTGSISFGIEQLLYGGGLWCYLEQLQAAKYNSGRQLSTVYKYQPKADITPELTKNQLIKPLFNNEKKTSLLAPDTEIKLSDEYFERGDSSAAITNYNQDLKLQPHEAEIYYKRGLARSEIGDYERAIADYTQAIQMNLNYAKAYNQRGLARYQLGDYEAAIEDYNQAIRINPYVAIVYINRADARSHIGDNQGAIEDYTQAIKINPNYATSDKHQGMAHYLIKEQPKVSQTIKIPLHDAVAYTNRGNSCLELGDYDEAIADYNQAMQINPNYADAYYHRGNAHYDIDKYEDAIADYTQVIKINSNYIEAYYNRGNARLTLADKQGALEDFQKAADLYWQEGKIAEHKDIKDRILDLQIEESLDILNF